MIQKLNYNFFNIIIIAGTIQGLIFGLVVLLLKRYNSAPNKYLAQLVIYLSLNNLYYWLVDTNLSDSFKYFEYLYVPWNLLVLPMYYFFVITFLNFKLTKNESFYLKLPFAISLLIHLFLLTHILFLIKYLKIPIKVEHSFYYAEEYFSILFTIYLIYKIFKIIKKYEFENNQFSITQVLINTKWLKQLLYFGFLICMFWFIIIFYNQYNINSLFKNNGKYFLWISMSILIYWLGYLGIYHVGIFNERKQIREENTKNLNQSKKSRLNYSKFEEIDLAIKVNKLYLNPNLNSELLADNFNLSRGYLSQLFNEFTYTNFSNYINQHRVEKAKKILVNKEYSKYTMVAIGFEAGFNSKSAFYNAFKKNVGVSPMEFRKINMS